MVVFVTAEYQSGEYRPKEEYSCLHLLFCLTAIIEQEGRYFIPKFLRLDKTNIPIQKYRYEYTVKFGRHGTEVVVLAKGA